MAATRFTLLQGIRAWRDGVELDLGSPQQRSVLALLLIADGRPVSIDQAVDALWGDAAPVRANGTVRTYVSRLRHILDGNPAIDRSAGGYVLSAGPGTVDTDIFAGRVAVARSARARGDLISAAHELRAALALCGGQALAGGCGPYLERHRTHLRQLRFQALEDCFAADVELGNLGYPTTEATGCPVTNAWPDSPSLPCAPAGQEQPGRQPQTGM